MIRRLVIPLLALPLGVLALSGALFFTGCKQGLNERCQITDDCQDGLICELQGNTPAQGGVCRSTSPVTDLMSAPSPDQRGVASPDLTSPADLLPSDGGGG